MRPAGVPLTVERKNSDAQQVEDRYGEIASEFAGLSNMASDAGKSVNKWWKNGGKQALANRAREMIGFGSLGVRAQRTVDRASSGVKGAADYLKQETAEERRRRLGIGKYAR